MQLKVSKTANRLISKNLTEVQKKDLTRQLKDGNILVRQLLTVITEKLVRTNKVTVSQYKDPSWAYYAADREGYKRALREIRELLSLENERIYEDE